MTIRRVAVVLLLAPTVSAQSNLDSLGYVAGAFGIMSLIYSYQLICARDGLDAQIAKRNAIIRKLDEDIKEKLTATSRKTVDAKLDSRVAEEVKKLETASKTQDHNGMPKGYWDRMEQMENISPQK